MEGWEKQHLSGERVDRRPTKAKLEMNLNSDYSMSGKALDFYGIGHMALYITGNQE